MMVTLRFWQKDWQAKKWLNGLGGNIFA